MASLLFALALGGGGCGAGRPSAPIPSTDAPEISEAESTDRAAAPKKPKLPAMDTYLVYYGRWDAEKIREARKFKLVIAAENTSAETIREIQDEGRTLVALYLSLGEEFAKVPAKGDGYGPAQWKDGKRLLRKQGIASYYVDANRDELPDGNREWGSFFVDANNGEWQAQILDRARAAVEKGADGLFLDTIDTANPEGYYPDMHAGMSELIGKLRAAHPRRHLIANRGLFYFDPESPAYGNTIRPYVSAVMHENYYTHWDPLLKRGTRRRTAPGSTTPAHEAAWLNEESAKADGFAVLVLDYFSRAQVPDSALFKAQVEAVSKQPGWINSVSEITLESIWTDLLK